MPCSDGLGGTQTRSRQAGKRSITSRSARRDSISRSVAWSHFLEKLRGWEETVGLSSLECCSFFFERGVRARVPGGVGLGTGSGCFCGLSQGRVVCWPWMLGRVGSRRGVFGVMTVLCGSGGAMAVSKVGCFLRCGGACQPRGRRCLVEGIDVRLGSGQRQLSQRDIP